MPLPVVSGARCIRALERAGFVVDRQSGSHVVMYRAEPLARAVVPRHRELRAGTLRKIITQSGMTVNEFVELL